MNESPYIADWGGEDRSARSRCETQIGTDPLCRVRPATARRSDGWVAAARVHERHGKRQPPVSFRSPSPGDCVESRNGILSP